MAIQVMILPSDDPSKRAVINLNSPNFKFVDIENIEVNPQFKFDRIQKDLFNYIIDNINY